MENQQWDAEISGRDDNFLKVRVLYLYKSGELYLADSDQQCSTGSTQHVSTMYEEFTTA